ncbi:MAG: hypothetical protein R3Y36_08020 [Spirochaetales bacterium]
MLKSYKTRVLCIYFFAVIFTVTAIVGSLTDSKGANLGTKTTVLLNPRYVPSVQTIKLSREKTNELFEIEKTDFGYRGIFGNIIFPVNTAKVNELLLIASSTRKLYTISDNYSAWNSLSIDDSSAVVLSFFGTEEPTVRPTHEFSRLYFGSEDFSRTNIMLRTADSPNVYRTQNDFYSFLQFYPSAWSQAYIVSDYIKNGKTEQDVQSVSFIQNGIETKLISGDENFISATQTIFSIQSFNIVPATVVTDNVFSQVRIVFSGNQTAEFSVYVGNNNTYYLVPVSRDLSYALEVSAQTYERIPNAFTATRR